MLSSNNIYNASVLDDCQKTLDVVADNVTFMSNKFRKWVENSLNGVKNIKLKFKKGFKYLQEKIPICPVCGSKKVIENGGRLRTIIFSTGEENFKIQGYNCKEKHYNDESQFFEADISDIVPDNYNYSYEFIDTVKEHNAPVHAPVRVTADFLNRNDILSVSHQTIQNIIFLTENPNEIPLNSSGKYTFDVLWCKAHGKWKSFYFCINDAITKEVIYDEIYTAETTVNLDKFFKAISKYLPEEKYITVDLEPKYKKILKKYGFKRQLCLKHAPKAIKNNLNNIKKDYKKKGEKISRADEKIIEEQKQKIIEMILNKDLKRIDKKFKEIMANFKSLHPCVQQLMNKMIIPNFDDFFRYLKVDGVEMTTNISELNFQKALPKHVKRRMHTVKGFIRRIHLKYEYRNKKSDEKFQKQLFPHLMNIVMNNDHI
jgi:transposase-like protein